MTAFDTPVLLIIFNRPRKTQCLIDALEKVRPKHIYIMADGPRKTVLTDQQDCKSARGIATHIPWECEVHTNFLEDNVGCDQAVPLGIDWFFENVEEGIILEDDCIPNASFFTFCANLLEKYADDEQIMHISGNNFQDGQIRGDGSYYFSLYSHSWGWATWRRAWDKFHPAITDMPNFNDKKCIESFPISKAAQKFWLKSYTSQRHWDSLWQYTIWHENGLSILPNMNLVTNIGFDGEATNTQEANFLSNLPTDTIDTLTHPSQKKLNTEADTYTYKRIFHTPLYKKILTVIQKHLTS